LCVANKKGFGQEGHNKDIVLWKQKVVELCCNLQIEEMNDGEALLKKKYYENCPGCKVDKAKELKTDVSFRNLLNIWMVVLCSGKLSLFNLILVMITFFLMIFGQMKVENVIICDCICDTGKCVRDVQHRG
jgi:hypothetical protein